MPHILLTGAGFSRNWGGWLTNEAFEYLLGCSEVDSDIRDLLWSHSGNYENALDELQSAFREKPDNITRDRLSKLQNAISAMFADMNKAFASAQFEFHHPVGPEYWVRSFLMRFDAIITLNHDLLLEPHYFDSGFGRPEYSVYRKWGGCQIPGMEPLPPEGMQPYKMNWVPMDSPEFMLQPNRQPYFKLHGSSNWIDDRWGREMLIMGGNKVFSIAEHPILMWNYERFREYLAIPHTRLMVIGYSFRDEHINNAIGAAADAGALKLFIVDPDGVDVLDREFRKNIFWKNSSERGPLLKRFQNHLIGASRRTLRDIFSGDTVEHGKVMRFFD